MFSRIRDVVFIAAVAAASSSFGSVALPPHILGTAVLATSAAAVSACRPPDNCVSFAGKCTGFGSRQCVTAPTAIASDAPTIDQCCGGSFQYPWVEVLRRESADARLRVLRFLRCGDDDKGARRNDLLVRSHDHTACKVNCRRM
jgi:hypothetical protein